MSRVSEFESQKRFAIDIINREYDKGRCSLATLNRRLAEIEKFGWEHVYEEMSHIQTWLNENCSYLNVSIVNENGVVDWSYMKRGEIYSAEQMYGKGLLTKTEYEERLENIDVEYERG